MELRDYQTNSLEMIRDAVRRGTLRLILQMPTAAGKTRLAAEIVNGARGKAKKVLFTVPALSLIDQTVEAFYAEGIRDVGVIQRDHILTDWSKPIQIASVQTLMKRKIPEADVVIRDECHKLFKFDLEWMQFDEWRHVPFIGLSATPWTKGLGRHYHELIIGATTRQLIDEGWLSPFRVFAPSHPDLKDVRTVAGDYHEGDLAQAMNREPLTADAVETWKKYAEGRPTVCFAVDCAHARALRDKFEAAGVLAGYMDARTPMNERAALRRKFESGLIQVMCSVDVIGMGVDWPDIACISYCRPTRSEIRFVQNIGRGLRRAEGKEDLLVLDHSDTTLRLGFVTDIHHDKLSDGKENAAAKPRKPLPKECKKCHFLKPAGVSICPCCGYKSEIPVSHITNGNGELVEYKELPEYKGKAEKFSHMDKQTFYSELLGYAEERGFKRGWAANQYREKFKVWPRGLFDVPAVASEKMRTWIKGRMIAYAKSKRAGLQSIAPVAGNAGTVGY